MAFSQESNIKAKIRKLKYQLQDLEDPKFREKMILKLKDDISKLKTQLEECQKTNTTFISKTKE